MDGAHLESHHRLYQNQPGLKFCYAERMAKRLRAMGQPRYANGCEITLHEEVLELPLSWKKPQRIVVNSMSDMFH